MCSKYGGCRDASKCRSMSEKALEVYMTPIYEDGRTDGRKIRREKWQWTWGYR